MGKKDKNASPLLKKDKFLTEFRKNKILFFMLIPAIAYVIIFNYIPMGGAIVAFKDFNFRQGILGSPWASNHGLANFTFLFTSGKLWLLTKNTVLYNLGFMVNNIFWQVLFAIIFSEVAGKYIKKFFQSTMILPYFISWVIVGGFVYNIFNYEFGMLNTFLQSIGKESINVYQEPGIWRWILTFASAWKIIGYGTIVYLAAVMGISHEIYESAYLDGAGIFKRIWYITLPLLRPTIVTMVLLSVGGIIRGNLDLFYQLIGLNGSLFDATDVIDTFVFRALTANKDIAMSSAAGFYQQIIGFFLVIGANSLVRWLDNENALF